MNFKDADNSMPAVIYEGYKFPHNYAIFGEANLHELNENNSKAIVYIGNRSKIQELTKEIADRLENYDYSNNDFIVVGLWDNHVEKTNDDYIMLAAIISNSIYCNPLEYMEVPDAVHQLTDNSTSDSDAWTAWGNLAEDYMYEVSQKEIKKVATVLLNNVSDNMLDNFRRHTEDDFLKSLLLSIGKLKP